MDVGLLGPTKHSKSIRNPKVRISLPRSSQVLSGEVAAYKFFFCSLSKLVVNAAPEIIIYH